MDALRLASAAATASHRTAPAPGVDAHGGAQRAEVQLGETPAPVPAQTRLQEHAEAGWCYRTALAAQPQAADAALATALGSAADLDWDALPAHINRLLACMAQPPSAAHQPLAVPLDPSQLIPLRDHPLLQRWLAALACQQRHSTGVAREKPKASTRDHRRQGRWRLGILTGGRDRSGSALEPSVAALFDAFDPQQVELYIYSDACSNHPRAINATHWHDSRHASSHLPRHAVPTSACPTPPRCWPASTRPSGSRWRSSRRGARSCSPCRARCCGCWHRRAPAARRPCHGATQGTARRGADGHQPRRPRSGTPADPHGRAQ